MKSGRSAPRRGSPTRDVWEGDRRRTSMVIAPKGKKAFTPHLVLWVDSASTVILASEIVDADAPDEVVAHALRKAISAPLVGAGPPRAPGRLRVARQEVADVVRPVADSLGIEVEVPGSLPALDGVFDALDAEMGSPANQGYLEKTDVPEPVLADLFAAAAEYYRLKPWKVLSDAEPVLLECDAWKPRKRYAVVMGAGGEAYGFALYETWAGLQRLMKRDPFGPGEDEVTRGTPAVSLVFTKLSELGPTRRDEATGHGWEVATRNAYPLVLRIDPKSPSHWPTGDDLRVVAAATRVLGPYVRSLVHPRWMPKGQTWVSETHRVSVAGDQVEVTATFPANARRSKE